MLVLDSFALSERRFDMNTIKGFFADETGLELSEYAVAAAIVGALVVLAFTNLGTTILNKINTLITNIGGTP
jgi:Flp pilus assembly pilin Flp